MQEEARGPELPDEPGFYALMDGKDDYQRLDGNQEWEVATWPQRSDMRPYVQFVIYDPALGRDLAPLASKVNIQQVAWVRSEIDQTGPIKPASGSKWVLANLDGFKVPITVRPIEGRQDAVHIVPNKPLDPGLYSIQLRAANVAQNARIGVQWNTVDQEKYSSGHCVDRYLGATSYYRSCADQVEVMKQIQSDGLRVYLVDPESKTINGEPTLVVKGVVINTADKHRSVPSLEASIANGSGAILKHWIFEAEKRELAPGQSVSFRTEMPRPPQQTSKVTVRFASTAAAGNQ